MGKKAKFLLHLSYQYDLLRADVKLLKETVQKLIDGKSRYIPNAKDFAEQLVAKNRSDRMQQTAKHEISLDSFKSLDNAFGYLMQTARFAKPTEAENKTQVLFMREEWEARKADAIKKARDEREATKERETTRCLLYNEGILESTDKSNEQNKSENEFEDTSDPEPYIQKELTKEEIDAKIIAVQKEIDMKLEMIREKQRKDNASNHNGN